MAMNFLEPDDPIEPTCAECGEEENIFHMAGDRWRCFACGENFSDGSDCDESEFHLN